MVLDFSLEIAQQADGVLLVADALGISVGTEAGADE